MRAHSARRRTGLPARAGTFALAVGLCLCAGQLMSEAPSLAATPVATQSTVAAYRAVHANKSAKVLAQAKALTGKRYRFAAAGPNAFDCSGYTMYVYRKAAGVKLPHKANSQQRYGRAVAKRNARPGDLIVIRSGSYGYHAGIYAGGGYMYDSPRPGVRVGKHKIWTGSYVVRRLV